MSIFDFFSRKATKLPASNPTEDVVSQHSTNDEPSGQEELSDADILLLEYCTYGTYPNPRNGYPLMWEREFNIADVDIALQSLEDRGYIRFTSAIETLPRFTVAQLKSVAEKNGVAVKGKKADILAAVSAIPPEKLESAIADRKYCLTAAGHDALKKYEPIVYVLKNRFTGISSSRMRELVCAEPDRPYRDLIWTEFQRQSYNLAQAGLSGGREDRALSLAMFFFLKQEHREKTALIHLHNIFFIDINDEYSPLIAPRIVEEAREIAKKINYTENDFFQSAQKIMINTYAPHKNFEDIDVAGIYTSLVFGHYDTAYKLLDLCPYYPDRPHDRCSTAESLVHQAHMIAGDLDD